MKKMPLEFYAQLDALRGKYGEKEYSRDELLPAAMALVKKHIHDDRELLRQAANDILDSIEKSEDSRGQDGLFPYDGQVALGEKHRIKRGAMNLDQHYRRKRIVDANYAAQARAWTAETEWLNVGIDALKERPASTKRVNVVEEDGAAKKG